MLHETHKYDDIIEREHPTSKTHPRMETGMRAAQFSPFAALTGLEEDMQGVAAENERQVACEIETERFDDVPYAPDGLRPIPPDTRVLR